jgi:hypothetical protein
MDEDLDPEELINPFNFTGMYRLSAIKIAMERRHGFMTSIRHIDPKLVDYYEELLITYIPAVRDIINKSVKQNEGSLLYLAITLSDVLAVQLLLENGASTHFMNPQPINAIDYAEEVLAELRQSPHQYNARIRDARDIIELLSAYGPARSSSGNLLASYMGSEDFDRSQPRFGGKLKKTKKSRKLIKKKNTKRRKSNKIKSNKRKH